MAEFLVKMADERGRMLQQIENGHTAAELRERFAVQGFLVYDVRPRSLLAGGEVSVRKKRVKLDQFVVFNSQFVTLIRAGLPIPTSLELLAKQQKDPYFRGVLEDVRQRVKSGESLSQAFEAQNVASKIYTTTLLAGEKSGNLEEVLNRYIAFQRVSMTFRKKLLASLIYPALLVAGMTVLFSVLVLFVVPRFAQLYEELHAELPPITAFLLQFGSNMQTYFPAMMLVLAGLGTFFWKWRQTENGSAAIDRFRLSLPLIGEIWLKYQVAMFARMMSTLLLGGLPLVSALETAGSSMESRLLARALSQSAQRVREGRPLARSLEETRIFPELSIGMVEVGESTGALPQMLSSVAEFFEEDVQTRLGAALSLIEPVILIVMGIVVAFVLISLYLPIFSLGAAANAASQHTVP
ncbi:MAG: type secretion system protein [Acidobacteriaceae bacterium]|nr:type secretion system protein [Acidobacteriaceae bacterium]